MQKSVLIVEDEYLIAMDLKEMLESRGWRVIGPAPTVQTALRLLEIEHPSAALLDINLRGELVTPVAEALKMRAIPFAVSSAYDNPERFGGEVLAGVRSVGKPTSERRVRTAFGSVDEYLICNRAGARSGPKHAGPLPWEAAPCNQRASATRQRRT